MSLNTDEPIIVSRTISAESYRYLVEQAARLNVTPEALLERLFAEELTRRLDLFADQCGAGAIFEAVKHVSEQ